VLVELSSLAGTAEALRAKIDRKSAFWKVVGQYPPNFHVEGDVPIIIFARIDRPMNAYHFVADSFHKKNFVAGFLQAKCDFRRKTAVLRF